MNPAAGTGAGLSSRATGGTLLAAVFASAVALFVVSRRKVNWVRVLAGSVIIGSGISAMHYTGMAAMRLPAMCSYDPLLLTSSVLSAIVISVAALWLTFRFREDEKSSLLWKTGSAIVMGAAISVMHYTGMAAARFTPSDIVPDTTHAVNTSTLGFTGVSSVTLLVLGVAVITSAVDRRFATQRLQLNASERRFRGLLEAVPEAILVVNDAGKNRLGQCANGKAIRLHPRRTTGSNARNVGARALSAKAFRASRSLLQPSSNTSHGG